MKVLFDTNVVLDLLLDREPFSEPAAELFSMVESRTIAGLLCATTITTIYYLVAKTTNTGQANVAIPKLMALFEIAPVNHTVLERALQSNQSDFEDAVLLESARLAGVEIIVTRDPRGFKQDDIRTVSPLEMMSILETIGDLD